MSIQLLFTSVGRRVELLRVFRQALKGLGIEGRIIAVDTDPLASGLHVADAGYVVPPVTSAGYIDQLAAIAQAEKASVVFPLIDPDIPVLARHRRRLESAGTRVAVVNLEAVRITMDKWKSNKFLCCLDLPVARSWLPGQIDPDTASYPLFVKPRCGSASHQAFKARNAEELRFFSHYVSQAIIQQYLSGPEITSDVICDLEGNVLAVVSRQRIRVRAGEVAIGKTVFDPALAEACVKIALALPARGPITVQCMQQEGRAVFTEINARLGGGAPCGVAAGSDWPRWLLARLAGIPLELPPLDSYSPDMYFSRFDDSLLLSPTDVQRMESRRL